MLRAIPVAGGRCSDSRVAPSAERETGNLYCSALYQAYTVGIGWYGRLFPRRMRREEIFGGGHGY
jgi:hypothetical protein